MDSQTWYQEKFDQCGAWDAWIWETVQGQDYASRRAYFSGFIVCSATLGRASAEITKQALKQGKAVLSWRDGEPLMSVMKIIENDDTDWKSGWGVQTEDIGVQR